MKFAFCRVNQWLSRRQTKGKYSAWHLKTTLNWKLIAPHTDVVQKKGGCYFEAKPICYKISAFFFKNNYSQTSL